MARLFAHMDGTPLLVAKLMYGTGLRLGEAVSLRLEDLNVSRMIVIVRDGTGGKDRMSVLPTALIPQIRQRARGAHFRWHIHETTMQRAVADAARASGINRRVTPHRFRHTFGTQLLRSGYDIRTVQQLLGHRDVQTTMLYLHHMNSGLGVRSPYDQLVADAGRSSGLADTAADGAGHLPSKPET